MPQRTRIPRFHAARPPQPRDDSAAMKEGQARPDIPHRQTIRVGPPVSIGRGRHYLSIVVNTAPKNKIQLVPSPSVHKRFSPVL
ncbi:hypothetical protein EYR38_010095 [Pleurotus pulmonarius]|nr:hypothetical protein EYR38_010095 [Pleurotus pulmonarius]